MSINFTSEINVQLIAAAASDRDVAYAAWVSNYTDVLKKDASDIEGLLRYLWREQHTSPFEHGMFKTFVEVPISVAREHMRHRTHSYNEMSGRYVEMIPKFYIPGRDRPLVQQGKVGNYTFTPGSDAQYAIMRTDQEASSTFGWERYQNQLQNGIAREVARNSLTLNTFTQYYDTVDPLNMMKFITLRTAPNALHEIQMVGRKMEEFLEEYMPITYRNFKRYEWKMVDRESA